MVLPLLLWKKTVVIVTAALLYPLLSPSVVSENRVLLGDRELTTWEDVAFA